MSLKLSKLKLLSSNIYKLTKNEFAKHKYSQMNREYKRMLRQAKGAAYTDYIKRSNIKCKASWFLVNEELGRVNNNSIAIDADDYNTFCIQSVNDIASSVDYDVDKAMEYCMNGSYVPYNAEFKWQPVTSNDIIETVNGLSSSRSCDIYGLSNCFVKQIILLIVTPLVFLTNLCFANNVFPKCLKVSKVIPLHKKGDYCNLGNYRPISLVPVISKIIESVMYKQLVNFFESKNYYHQCNLDLDVGSLLY